MAKNKKSVCLELANPNCDPELLLPAMAKALNKIAEDIRNRRWAHASPSNPMAKDFRLRVWCSEAAHMHDFIWEVSKEDLGLIRTDRDPPQPKERTKLVGFEEAVQQLQEYHRIGVCANPVTLIASNL